MQHYRKAVELGGGALAHYNLGRALGRQGQFDQAITEYRAALAEKPDWAEAENNLGSVLFSLRRYAEAVGHFDRAVQLKSDYPLAHNNLQQARAAAAAAGSNPGAPPLPQEAK